MNQENNDGLEFDVAADDTAQNHSSTDDKSQLKRLLRESYRLPVKTLKSFKVQINQIDFVPLNLVVGDRSGVGIMLEDKILFSEGEQLNKIQLTLDGKDIFAQGKIQHISPNGDGNYICGIELLDLGKKDSATLKKFSKKCYSKLFSK